MNILEGFLHIQKKYAWLIILIGFVLITLCYPKAVRLLSNVKTDLINLLPEKYPTCLLYTSDAADES